MGSGSRTSDRVFPTYYSSAGGNPRYGTYTVYEKVTWDFPSPRPKPNPLTPTTGRIERIQGNVSIIRQDWMIGLTRHWAQGPARFVYVQRYGLSGTKSESFDTSTELNALLSRAIRNASSGEVDFGAFIGELGSSSKMIANRGKQIFNLLNAMRKGDMQRLRNYGFDPKVASRIKNTPKSKRLANHYLEGMFGWLPLISDVWNSVDAVRTSLREKGSTVSGRASYGQGGRSISSPRASVKLDYQVTNPGLRSLQELGLLNPLSVAWELTPFSFFVDYFCNIGDSLRGITVGLGTQFVGGSFNYENGINVFSKDGGWLETRKTCWRSPLLSIPSPSIQFTPPKSSWQRISTTIALIRQLL